MSRVYFWSTFSSPSTTLVVVLIYGPLGSTHIDKITGRQIHFYNSIYPLEEYLIWPAKTKTDIRSPPHKTLIEGGTWAVTQWRIVSYRVMGIIRWHAIKVNDFVEILIYMNNNWSEGFNLFQRIQLFQTYSFKN